MKLVIALVLSISTLFVVHPSAGAADYVSVDELLGRPGLSRRQLTVLRDSAVRMKRIEQSLNIAFRYLDAPVIASRENLSRLGLTLAALESSAFRAQFNELRSACRAKNVDDLRLSADSTVLGATYLAVSVMEKDLAGLMTAKARECRLALQAVDELNARFSSRVATLKTSMLFGSSAESADMVERWAAELGTKTLSEALVNFESACRASVRNIEFGASRTEIVPRHQRMTIRLADSSGGFALELEKMAASCREIYELADGFNRRALPHGILVWFHVDDVIAGSISPSQARSWLANKSAEGALETFERVFKHRMSDRQVAETRGTVCSAQTACVPPPLLVVVRAHTSELAGVYAIHVSELKPMLPEEFRVLGAMGGDVIFRTLDIGVSTMAYALKPNLRDGIFYRVNSDTGSTDTVASRSTTDARAQQPQFK